MLAVVVIKPARLRVLTKVNRYFNKNSNVSIAQILSNMRCSPKALLPTCVAPKTALPPSCVAPNMRCSKNALLP